MITKIIGIDPGLTGGLVVISIGNNLLQAEPFPVKDKAIDLEKLDDFLTEFDSDKTAIYLEDYGSGFMVGSIAMRSAGYFRGTIETACFYQNLKVKVVKPAKWTKFIHEGLNKDLKPKAKSALAVEKLFPTFDFRAKTTGGKISSKLHDGLVDGALIASYGRVVELGEI